MSIELDASPPLLTATVVVEDGCPVVSLIGELDVAGGPVVQAASHFWDVYEPRVVLDLSRLRFLDCAGIGVLMAFRRRVLDKGGSLSARHAAGEVAMVLEATGVDDAFGLPARRHAERPTTTARPQRRRAAPPIRDDGAAPHRPTEASSV